MAQSFLSLSFYKKNCPKSSIIIIQQCKHISQLSYAMLFFSSEYQHSTYKTKDK